MSRHENPQRQAQVYYPEGHPRHQAPPTPPPGVKPPTPAQVENAAKQASAPKEDLGDVIRGIGDLSGELHTQFFAIPNIADGQGRIDPEKFDTATRYALVSAGNALDYAIRLISERGSFERITELRHQLAQEMRAAGMTGDPQDGESPMPN